MVPRHVEVLVLDLLQKRSRVRVDDVDADSWSNMLCEVCQGVSPYLGLKPLVGRCVEDSVLVRNLGLGLLA